MWFLLQADAEFSLTTCEQPVMFDLAKSAAVDNLAAFESMSCKKKKKKSVGGGEIDFKKSVGQRCLERVLKS